jgi:peptidoglycan/LPS O-acetylase OafA/YrhL
MSLCTDEVPLGAQLFVTAALRNLSACSAAFLLFRCLVPKSHPWHFGILNSFLSLSIWKEIANISFVSYLIHLRIIMELIYSSKWRSFFGIIIPAIIPVGAQTYESLLLEWILIMVKIFFVGMCISFAVAKVLHEVIEKPAATFIGRFVFPSETKGQQGKEKTN